MKILKPVGIVVAALTVALILTFSTGCKKPPHYEPDYNNSYFNSNPTHTGGEAQPLLRSFTPTSGLPTTVVKISGNYFSANPIVTVGGMPATVNAVNLNTIYFTVPSNAQSGPIVVKTGGTTITSVIDFKVLTSTPSTYLTFNNAGIEHISFNRNGDLIGESTNGVYQISASGNTGLYNAPYTFGSLWGSAAYDNMFVYVADRVNAEILRISSDRSVGVLAGGTLGIADGIGAKAQFNLPVGIALDSAGNIYTTDTHRVRKITSSGLVTTIAGGVLVGKTDGAGAKAQFGNLQGIAYGDTCLYVTDRQFLNVRKVTQEGVVTTVSGSGVKGLVDGTRTTAQFVNPVNVLVDAAGNLIVADGDSTTGYAIRLVNKYGLVSTLLSGSILNAPDGMTLDPQGNLYIVNTGANNIIKLTFK